MNEAQEKTAITLYKVKLLVGIMQRDISIDEAIEDEDTEQKRILSIAQNIDINELRHYLEKMQQKTGVQK